MRKPSMLLKLLLLIIFYSCSDEAFVTRQESAHKQDILNYFDKLKSVSDEKSAGLIDKTIASLDFGNVSEMKMTDNERLLIVDVKKLKELESEGTIKALFFINETEIVRSNLMTFSDQNADHHDIISSVLNGKFNPKSYSGKVSVFSVSHDINFFFRTEGNKLKESGSLNRKAKVLEDGRTNGCIDWYLVTTYYYANGNKRTEDQYLFTTCDDACNETRINGRTNCGGGGGGVPYTGGPAFPSYPINGDRYQYMRPNGEKVDYIYVAPLNSWVMYLITTPDVVVQNNPHQYPDLLTDGPEHGLIKVTGDGFLFEYNGYTGSWVGSPGFYLPGLIEKPEIDLNQFIDCFGTTQSSTATYKITVYVEEPIPGSEFLKVGGNVGHTFVGLTKIENGQEITQHVGFYPIDNTLLYPIGSKMVDNEETEWTVRVSFEVEAVDFAKALNAAKINSARTYHISQYNCTDFAFSVCDAAGISLPKVKTEIPLYGLGHSPARLGYDLRQSIPPGGTRSLAGGLSPGSHGPCL